MIRKRYIIAMIVSLSVVSFAIGLAVGLSVDTKPDWNVPPDMDFLNDYPIYRTGESWDRRQFREAARQEIGRLIVRDATGLNPYNCRLFTLTNGRQIKSHEIGIHSTDYDVAVGFQWCLQGVDNPRGSQLGEKYEVTLCTMNDSFVSI